jgi:hypothetical protein
MFSTSLVIKGKNSYGGYPKKFASSTQNPKKMIGTQNLPKKMKIFPKKECLVPKKRKGAKNSHGTYPTELAGKLSEY